MFTKLSSMKIKQRLNYGYRVVIILMVVSGLLSIISLSTLKNELDEFVNGANRADTAVKICRIDVNIAARSIREMALNEDTSTYPEYRQKVVEHIEEIGTELEALQATGLIDDALYQKYAGALTEWGGVGYEIVDKIESGDQEGAVTQILTECAPALDEVVTIAEEIDVITDELMQDAIFRSQVTFWISLVVTMAFIVIAVVLSMKIGKVIVKSITDPLTEIEEVAVKLSEGDLHSYLEYHSDDEIGRLAHGLRKSIRILGSYVDDIARAMKEFSDGNFDVKPEVEWKGDFVAILDSFMDFMKNMSVTITGIQSVADQVKSGSDQVSASAAELAEGATEQASVTEELAATIESVSEQVSQNAENAAEISKKVEGVGDAIVDSNHKMQEMVNAMTEINEESQKISQIIATINDIAAQTNLLALNASIEAARAGEAGRGFAVVADQVSVLAAQSAEAAKESSTLIGESVSAVGRGMTIADETARQLEEVLADSRAATEGVSDIAEALKNQAEAFVQINVGVDQINDVVQTNSATSEECAAASAEMSNLATHLDELIGQFTIAEV